MDPIPVLLMLPPAGGTPAESWLAAARRAAALDLAARLQGLPQVESIHAAAPDPADRERLAAHGVALLPAVEGEFHFGRAVAQIARSLGWSRMAYFGGASAPLASSRFLEDAFQQAGPGRVVVNNYHSTDWAILSQTKPLIDLADRLVTDNPLGWVLHHEAGLEVRSFPPTAASRADIDTPTDVALLRGHPDAGPEVRTALQSLPPALASALDRLEKLIDTPASTLAIIGRLSSGVWQELEARAQIWVRVFAEERGMLASGRLDRGEVQSLIGKWVDRIGPTEFLQELAEMADGVIWDTRVWMANRGAWAPPSDRFAADLGDANGVADPALRQLTQAVAAARVPVLVGGHGVVAGGLLAMLETIRAGRHRNEEQVADKP